MRTTPEEEAVGPAIIVVHGVGAQEQGRSVQDLAVALAKEVCAAPGRLGMARVEGYGAVVIPPPQDAEAGAVLSAHGAVTTPDGSRLWTYEFHWADESRRGTGPVGAVRDAWRLFVGLPRLGLLAMAPPQGDAGRASALLAWTYGLVWSAIIARLLANLIITLAAVGFGMSGLRQAEWALPFDLAVSVSALLFVGTLLLRGLARRGWPPGGLLAMIALTIAFLFTQVVPLAVAPWGQQAAESIRERVGWRGAGDPGAAAERPWLTFLGPEADARWFYAPNTWPGLWPYVVFGLVVLRAGTTAVASFPLSRLRPGRRAHRRRPARVQRLATPARSAWWLLISVNALVISPLFDIAALIDLAGDVPPDPLAQPDREPEIVAALSVYCDLIVIPFVLVVAGLLFSTGIRSALAPLVELALDVMSYLPRLPRLDATRAGRLLFGAPERPGLHRTLPGRLRALIEAAARRHRPVVLVTHSLGSIIALEALDGWTGDLPPGTILLLTMGSPLALLADAYPHWYGSRRRQGSGWSLGSIARWQNGYRDSDPVGLALSPSGLAGIPGRVEDMPLGPGGHTGYFTDPDVARRIRKLIRNHGK